MELKKKAWIATSVLMAIILIWSTFAVHNAAVAAAKANADKSSSGGGCPFTGKKAASVKSEGGSCCANKAKADENEPTEKIEKATIPSAAKAEKATISETVEADDKFDQYTPEQISQCPHLKSLQAKKTKSKRK